MEYVEERGKVRSTRKRIELGVQSPLLHISMRQLKATIAQSVACWFWWKAAAMRPSIAHLDEKLQHTVEEERGHQLLQPGDRQVSRDFQSVSEMNHHCL